MPNKYILISKYLLILTKFINNKNIYTHIDKTLYL